jgi:hypothetical protein
MIMNANPLQREMATYNKVLPSLLDREGKFALVVGDDLVGVFESYEDALKAGYAKAGITPFLVKRIAGTEAISFFSRDIFDQCPA